VTRTYADVSVEWGGGVPNLVSGEDVTDVRNLVHEVYAKVGGVFAIYLTDDKVSASSFLPISNLKNEEGVVLGETISEYGSVDSTSAIFDNFAFSWQVPDSASSGEEYFVGLQATVDGDSYAGIWKVQVTDRATFYTTQNFFAKDVPKNVKTH
jgi:hypothetical protein